MSSLINSLSSAQIDLILGSYETLEGWYSACSGVIVDIML
jgi:hypothetical protein